jgi:ankyrin repeat protein
MERLVKKFVAPILLFITVSVALLGVYGFYPNIRLAFRHLPTVVGPNHVNPRNYDAEWFDAARAGRTDILGALLDAKFPVDTKNSAGYTAVILAAYDEQPEALDYLLRHDANPCLADRNGNTALMGALFKGEMAIAYTLAKTMCPIDQTNNAGETALAFAALFGRTGIIPFLVARGADPSHKDFQGQTPLVVASKQGNEPVIKVLRAVTFELPHARGAGAP